LQCPSVIINLANLLTNAATTFEGIFADLKLKSNSCKNPYLYKPRLPGY